MKLHHLGITMALLFLGPAASQAAVEITVGRNDATEANPGFRFNNVPAPSRQDAAATAQLTIVDGVRDPNGGDVAKPNDGLLPSEEDEPRENFFFRAGTDGGRLQLDVGRVINVRQINTYSWHSNTRAPQVYTLYASAGSGSDFNPRPRRTIDPEQCGWHRIANVDTRPKTSDLGGQYGVSVHANSGFIGQYRYLLFDMVRTETADA